MIVAHLRVIIHPHKVRRQGHRLVQLDAFRLRHRRGGRFRRVRPLIHQPPHDEQDQNRQQDQNCRQQIAQTQQMLLGVALRQRQRPGFGAGQVPGQLGGVLLRGQRLEELGHGLDALHRLQLQAHPEHVGKVLRHGGVHRPGAGVGVRHQPLCRRDRTLAADHSVDHRRKAVFIGVAALKLGGGILLRGRVTLVQLLVQAAARRAQPHRRVAGQPGAAVFQHPDVLRADAPVHKADLVHGGHAVEHRLQHGADLLRRQRAGMLIQPAAQRHAAGVFHHGIDGVVFLEHVQHRLQAVGRGDALDGAVKVGKVHPGGLEQHLAAQFGPQGGVHPPLRRQRQGHILLDGHPEAPDVLRAPVQDALTVDPFDLADGIPPAQHRAHRQTARRIAPCEHPAAMRASRRALVQLRKAVRADDGHGKTSFCGRVVFYYSTVPGITKAPQLGWSGRAS